MQETSRYDQSTSTTVPTGRAAGVHCVEEPAVTRFLGIRFHGLTLEQCLDSVLQRESDGSSAALVTPNVDHVVRINQEGEGIGTAYSAAWRCVNDSRIIAALARLRGLRLPVVAGSDLLLRLLNDRRLPRDTRIVLVGGTPDYVPLMYAQFGLTNVRHIDAPFGLRYDALARERVARQIEEQPCDLALLAVGSPQQELIAARLQAGRGGGTVLCIGAAVEFALGLKKRAPNLVSRLGLEWAHRLVQEPHRLWRRYLVTGPKVFVIFARELLADTLSQRG